MRYKKLVAFPVLALSALALIVAASADEKIGPYNLIDTILIPGNFAVLRTGTFARQHPVCVATQG